jgi:hypothetical protein
MALWDRRLWGVQLTSPWSEALLLCEQWHEDSARPQTRRHEGEPTRALLFTTRTAAREWCAAENAAYRSHPKGDVVRSWRVRPVRVRERVTPV